MTGNSFFDTAIYYVTGILLLSISLIVFEMVTRYKTGKKFAKATSRLRWRAAGRSLG